MSNALDKIKKLASGNTSNWIDEAQERQENKPWADRSKRIAVRILREIRTQKPLNGMTQKKLADEMGVSPQYINKVVKGKENLTLETIAKIEAVLGVKLLEIPCASPKQGIVFSPNEPISTIQKSQAIPAVKQVISMYPEHYSKPEGTNG